MLIHGYELAPVASDIEAKGLLFDKEGAARACEVFSRHRFTQGQVNAAFMCHANEVVRTWNRKNFGLKFRIFVALYWLGFFKNPFAECE